MLGGLSVVQGDRRITRFQTQKTGALLAYLALNPNKNHSRESLAEMLWPEGDPTAIRNRLNQAISSLRRQLHPPELGPGTVLVTDHHSVGINSVVVSTDFEDFERDLKLADRSETREDKIRYLEAAIGLYRGELLEGYYEEWVFSKRMHLADQYDQVLQQLIRAHAEAGNYDNAIEFGRIRLQQDPYDEVAHTVLMKLYLMARRPKSALKQFDDLVRALETYDDEPSELAHKYRAKAQAALENPTPPPDDDTLPEVPVERRRSADTVVIVQPAPVEEPVPSLPRVISTFVGRDTELATLCEVVTNTNARLVTIMGLGGCGKTRLAIEAGWQLFNPFEGRVFFVPLSNLEEAGSLAAEIARVVLADRTIDDDPFEAVLKRLCTMPDALLILDNFEQLVEDGAPTVKKLLELTPNLRCLVTTRVPLNLEGEIQFPLLPLAIPDTEGELVLKDLAANPSVALFVERAQTAKADFQLTERTAQSIANLCIRLEGLPLSLELAASWARVLTPCQMLAQVSENLNELENRRRDINPRHRSLRAVFDTSFDMLDEPLKQIFLRLTTFSDGWDLEAATSVCPGVDILEAILNLEERSMVFSQPTENSARFAMLETLRTFGKDLVTGDLSAECGWLHAEHFLNFAEQNLPWPTWAATITPDYANCMAAMKWLSENDRGEEAVRLAVAMARYWDGKGMLSEGRECLEELLAKNPDLPPLLTARAINASAGLEWLAGDFAKAAERTEGALEVFKKEDSKRDQIEALYILQLEAHRKGDYEASRKILYTILDLAEALDDQTAVARCWLSLGNAAIEQDDWEMARAYYERSLEVGRRRGTNDRVIGGLTNLANLSVLTGQYDAARKWIEEAIPLIPSAELRWNGAMTLVVAAKLENALGNYEKAVERLVEALRTAPKEKIVVWRFLLHFSVALTGLEMTQEAIRASGFFEHYREIIGEKHRGVEMSWYADNLAVLQGRVSEGQFQEQFAIGRLMSVDEMNALITRVSRQQVKLLEVI